MADGPGGSLGCAVYSLYAGVGSSGRVEGWQAGGQAADEAAAPGLAKARSRDMLSCA